MDTILSFYKDVSRALSADLCTDLVSVTQFADDLIGQQFAAKGLSFLTVDLPSLGKAIDASLANNTPLHLPEGWTLQESSALPVFHYPSFRAVFEDDGSPRRDGDARSVKCLRQLCFAFYKLGLPFTTSQMARAVENYLLTEVDISKPFNGGEEVLRVANLVVRRMLAGFDPRVITPRHGPGAVSTGEKLWEKMNFKRFIPQLDELYPYADHMYYNYSHLCDELERLVSMSVCPYPTNKIVFVPKDSRGPRTISCEPLELQWCQQGLARKLMEFLEAPRSLSSGRINFTDQSINQRMALIGSATREWATLDMKDASDRVSLPLVKRLFEGTAILPYLLGTRSTHARMPDGQLTELMKFAPMGSALCFPVEAICFYALIVAEIHLRTRLPVKAVAREVYVYGDDIIVKAVHAPFMMETLPQFHLRVNKDKSCVEGPFRESCGCDAYLGVDVTPTKFRRHLSLAAHSPEYMSWIESSNHLYTHGFYIAANLIERFLTQYWTVWYTGEEFSAPTFVRPYVLSPRCVGPRRYRYRWNSKLHRGEIYSTALAPLKRYGSVSGWCELLRFSTQGKAVPLSRLPNLSKFGVNERRAEAYEYALQKRVKLQRGWHARIF